MTKSKVISVSPEVMGGTAVFQGSRVPIKTFLEYIENGETIDLFLADFPTVTKEQLTKVISEFKEKLQHVAAS